MCKNYFFLFLLLLLPVLVFANATTELEQAVAEYERIVTDFPGTDEALDAQEKLAILYIENDLQSDAAAVYDKLITDFAQHPGLARSADHVADAYREQKRYDKALEIYQYMVDNYPQAQHTIDSQMGIARIKLLQKDYAGADEATDRLLAEFNQYEGFTKVLDLLADEYREAKKYEKAKKLYGHVVENYPDSKQAVGSLSGVVRCCILSGDDTNAQGGIDLLFTRFVDREGSAKAADLIADEYRKKDKYEKALSIYHHAVASWPGAKHVIQSQGGIARCYIALGDDPNAVAAVDKLVMDFGEHPELRNVLGDVAEEYEEHEQYSAAKAVYAKITEIATATTGSSLESSKAQIIYHMNDGNDAAAMAVIDELMSDCDDEPGLGKLLLEVADKYYRIARNNVVIAVNAKRNGDESGESLNRSKAEELFKITVEVTEKVIQGLPGADKETLVESYHLAAENLRRLGEYEKAADYYQQVVDIDPDYKWAGSCLYLLGYCLRHSEYANSSDKCAINPIIKEINMSVVEDYPNSSAAKPALNWLERYSE